MKPIDAVKVIFVIIVLLAVFDVAAGWVSRVHSHTPTPTTVTTQY